MERNRPKILIVIDSIHVGGISKSLVNLLPHLSLIGDCDLLVFDYLHFDRSLIPESVNIVIPPKILYVLGMDQHSIKQYSKKYYCIKILFTIIARLFNGAISRRILFFFAKKTEEYDIAISYSQDTGWKTISTGCNQYVISNVNSTKKISFVHCDYSMFGGYNKHQEKYYKQFDRIVCVSNSCKNSFSKMFPRLADLCTVCENYINEDEIIRKTKGECFQYTTGKISFVTVCRIGKAKGLIRALHSFRRLLDDGLSNFEWVIVGDGPEFDNTQKEIQRLSLSEYVKMVGGTSNPFYYMKNADLFLHPSFHEAAPMVYGECQALNLPVLTTNTLSAVELVERRNLGIVCDNSEDGIYQSVREILTSREIYKVSKTDSLNRFAEKQLSDLINEMEKKDE